MNEELVLKLLTGRKVLENGVWTSYDEFGVAIADPDGILLRGALGALLLGNLYKEVVPEPPAYIPQMNAFGGHPVRDWVQIPKRKVRRNRRDEILFLTH